MLLTEQLETIRLAEEPAGFVWAPEYLALPRDPIPFVIKHLVPTSGFTNIYGKPKVGKSYLSILMAMAVSDPSINHVLGFRVMKHGPVAYLQIDTPRGEWAERFARLTAAGYNITQIALADMSTVPYPFNILEPSTSTWLKQRLATIKPVMVVVDTLRESFDGDENDANTMKQVFTALKVAAGDAALVLVSHSRKDSAFNHAGGEDLMGDNRGSVYTAGKVDTVIRVTQHSISYQGRSIGRGNIPIVQDKELGLTKLGAFGDSDELREHVEQAARDLIMAKPDASRRELARELQGMFDLSESTARRRITHVFETMGQIESESDGPEVNLAHPTNQP